MMGSPVVLQLIAILFVATLGYGSLNESPYVVRTNYTFRSSYPDYCSSPKAMEKRKIPPLPASASGLKIKQLVVVIRHGARTPWQDHNCWEGYSEDPKQSRYDCDVNSIMAPPRHHLNDLEDRDKFLFTKKYDGLNALPIENMLDGTCALGQLIGPGYYQELTNGQHLRVAYLGNLARDPSMQLFDSTLVPADSDSSIYFRSDDDQRTLMSGQMLFSSLFDVSKEDTNIILHTADKPHDILGPSTMEKSCPYLGLLKEQAMTSSEYKSKMNDSETKYVSDLFKYQLKNDLDLMGVIALDCQMTAMCSDRHLPDAINDFKYDNDDSNFSKLYDLTNWMYTFPFGFNDSAYAKQFTSFLWGDILYRLQKKTRLMLYSAHDDTLINLLLSLDIWDKKWPPYASMMNIEIYEDDINSPEQSFRLLFNGEVLTQNISGCSSDICSLDILLDKIKYFSSLQSKCVEDDTDENIDKSSWFAIENQYFDRLISFIIGSVTSLVSVYLFGWIKRRSKDYVPIPTDTGTQYGSLSLE